MIRREWGRGTFVARPRVRAETTRIGGLRNSLHLDARSNLQTRLLGCFARRANEEERKALEPVRRCPRLGDLPVAVAQPAAGHLGVSTIPKLLAPDLGTYFEAHDRRLAPMTSSRRFTG